MTEIDKLALLRIRNRRVLCARSKGKATWYLPGGKHAPGESDHAALLREIREERSVDLIRATIVFAGEFSGPADGRPEGTIVRSRCYHAQFNGKLAAAAEIEKLAGMID